MAGPYSRGWWADDPAIVVCDFRGCGCPIQRTPTGTIEDGMRLHVATVHEGNRPVSVDDRRTAVSR